MSALYIIGNGFDLDQGANSSYRNFNDFMCKNYTEAHERIGRYIDLNNTDLLWSNFEDNLGNINLYNLACQNIDFWLHNDEDYMEKDFDKLSDELRIYFQEWICKELLNFKPSSNKKIQIKNIGQSLFLNFNYTNYLETSYGVSKQQICYIHGDTTDNPNNLPITGHGLKSSEIDERINQSHEYLKNLIQGQGVSGDFDKVDALRDKIEAEYKVLSSSLIKDTSKMINSHKAFFDKIKHSGITDVYIMGHSLSAIDIPYFEYLLEDCNTCKARWHMSYYGKCRRQKKKDKFNKKQLFQKCFKRYHIKFSMFTIGSLRRNNI